MTYLPFPSQFSLGTTHPAETLRISSCIGDLMTIQQMFYYVFILKANSRLCIKWIDQATLHPDNRLLFSDKKKQVMKPLRKANQQMLCIIRFFKNHGGNGRGLR